MLLLVSLLILASLPLEKLFYVCKFPPIIVAAVFLLLLGPGIPAAGNGTGILADIPTDAGIPANADISTLSYSSTDRKRMWPR
jgi:hypothetical protein